MKKKLFKRTAITLSAAVALLALAGCSSKEEDAATSGGKTDAKTLKISVDGDSYAEYVNSVKADFEKEHNVKIEVTTMLMTDQLDALALDGPSGNGPDVMISPYDRVGSMGKNGQLLDVSEEVIPEEFSDSEIDLVSIDDKQYGVPLFLESLILYYNTDLLPEAPATFAELEALSKDDTYAFEGENGKNVAFLAKWTDFYYAAGLLQGYDGYVFGNDGKDATDVGLASPGGIEAVNYAWDWFNNVWPQGMKDITGAGDFITENFTTGKTAAIIDGPWMAATFKEAGVNYAVATIPTLSNGNSYSPFAGGKAWVGSAFTKEPDLTKELLKYLGSAENVTKFYEATGEVPANPTSRAEVPADDALTNTVISQFEVASPMPNIPEMSEVWVGAESMMFDAVSGSKADVEKVVKTANDGITEAIKEKFAE